MSTNFYQGGTRIPQENMTFEQLQKEKEDAYWHGVVDATQTSYSNLPKRGNPGVQMSKEEHRQWEAKESALYWEAVSEENLQVGAVSETSEELEEKHQPKLQPMRRTGSKKVELLGRFIGWNNACLLAEKFVQSLRFSFSWELYFTCVFWQLCAETWSTSWFDNSLWFERRYLYQLLL